MSKGKRSRCFSSILVLEIMVYQNINTWTYSLPIINLVLKTLINSEPCEYNFYYDVYEHSLVFLSNS